MSLLDCVRVCHGWRPEAYRPWYIGRTRVGRLRHALAERLRDFSNVFEVSDQAVALRSALDDFAGRSEAVDGVVRDLVEAGEIERYRGEPYPVVPLWGDEPVLKIDRARCPTSACAATACI